jgi:penicillin-binding protein 1C
MPGWPHCWPKGKAPGRALAALCMVLAVGVGALALDHACPPNLSRLHVAATEIADREGRPLAALPAPGGVWRLATRAEDVPPHLVDLLVAAEDRRFFWHPGVDPLALARAAVQWARSGRVVSGGSTLTMQAARLLEPRPRSLRSKLVEIARALQLEARFSKREILGIWLTLAPQGGNLEGVRAGALAWFGRPAARLDVAEAALLIAIPRRPEATRPDRHPEAAEAARNAVLFSRARGAAGITSADVELAAPVPRQRQRMPGLAPHLARELAREAPGRWVATTLDAGLQRAAEELAGTALRGLPERVSLAMMVADWRAREVRVLVGGAFGEEARAGALDLTRAVRSPGSALKPLLYALAFESGTVQPGTLLDDLPRRFGAYAPENIDRGFAGRITVAEALRHSLNLPAVALLDEIGPLRFASALKAAGAPPRLPAGADASLPLALGGAGETLRDMLALYATLADGGRAAPLRLTPGATEAGRQVVERRAVAMVTGILVNPFPTCGPPGIAWKTGTSWGGRDAWALGFDGRHVAGVWVGRPDGTPMLTNTGQPNAMPTGARLALPLLAQLFERLPPAPLPRQEQRPQTPPLAEKVDRLRLLFPPPGAVLTESEGHVTLRAAGGRRPLVFLVDGRPLAHEAARREAAWTPEGPGFYRVTVLDANGIAANAQVRVR